MNVFCVRNIILSCVIVGNTEGQGVYDFMLANCVRCAVFEKKTCRRVIYKHVQPTIAGKRKKVYLESDRSWKVFIISPHLSAVIMICICWYFFFLTLPPSQAPPIFDDYEYGNRECRFQSRTAIRIRDDCNCEGLWIWAYVSCAEAYVEGERR